MTKYFKSTMMVMAGLCWLAFALLIGIFLYQYLSGGAGLQVFGFFFPVSSGTVLIGLVHFLGFVAAAVLCFTIGVGLCVHGIFPAPERETVAQPTLRFAALRRLIVSGQTHEEPEASLRCVCCRCALATPVEICPECGWSQPNDYGA